MTRDRHRGYAYPVLAVFVALAGVLGLLIASAAGAGVHTERALEHQLEARVVAHEFLSAAHRQGLELSALRGYDWSSVAEGDLVECAPSSGCVRVDRAAVPGGLITLEVRRACPTEAACPIQKVTAHYEPGEVPRLVSFTS